MFKFFRRHRTVVMVSLIICAAGLVLFQGGSSSFMASPRDTIAKVNGRNIHADRFETVYRAMSRQRPEAGAQEQKELMQQALTDVIRQDVLSREAERYGIRVTDEELRHALASVPQFQRDGRFDPATYEMVVRRTFGVPTSEFEETHRKDIAIRKLNFLVTTAVQVPDTEEAIERDQVLAAEKDPKLKQKLQSDAAELRERIREKQENLVIGDWLNRLNSQLKVTIVSEAFKRRMAAGGAPQ